MQCAHCAPNGPSHLGFCVLQPEGENLPKNATKYLPATLIQKLFNCRIALSKSAAVHKVRGLTTWTALQNDDPNHLELRFNALPEHQMALVTSGCVPFR